MMKLSLPPRQSTPGFPPAGETLPVLAAAISDVPRDVEMSSTSRMMFDGSRSFRSEERRDLTRLSMIVRNARMHTSAASSRLGGNLDRFATSAGAPLLLWHSFVGLGSSALFVAFSLDLAPFLGAGTHPARSWASLQLGWLHCARSVFSDDRHLCRRHVIVLLTAMLSA